MLGFEQGQDMVGKVATFMVFGWFLLELPKDLFLGVNPQYNLCHYVSGMEQFAD
jgi:hypothetical protein